MCVCECRYTYTHMYMYDCRKISSDHFSSMSYTRKTKKTSILKGKGSHKKRDYLKPLGRNVTFLVAVIARGAVAADSRQVHCRLPGWCTKPSFDESHSRRASCHEGHRNGFRSTKSRRIGGGISWTGVDLLGS